MKSDHDFKLLEKERAQINLHNKRHQQLMSTKSLFCSIEILIKKKKYSALDEFF